MRGMHGPKGGGQEARSNLLPLKLRSFAEAAQDDGVVGFRMTTGSCHSDERFLRRRI